MTSFIDQHQFIWKQIFYLQYGVLKCPEQHRVNALGLIVILKG